MRGSFGGALSREGSVPLLRDRNLPSMGIVSPGRVRQKRPAMAGRPRPPGISALADLALLGCPPALLRGPVGPSRTAPPERRPDCACLLPHVCNNTISEGACSQARIRVCVMHGYKSSEGGDILLPNLGIPLPYLFDRLLWRALRPLRDPRLLTCRPPLWMNPRKAGLAMAGHARIAKDATEENLGNWQACRRVL